MFLLACDASPCMYLLGIVLLMLLEGVFLVLVCLFLFFFFFSQITPLFLVYMRNTYSDVAESLVQKSTFLSYSFSFPLYLTFFSPILFSYYLRSLNQTLDIKRLRDYIELVADTGQPRYAYLLYRMLNRLILRGEVIEEATRQQSLGNKKREE